MYVKYGWRLHLSVFDCVSRLACGTGFNDKKASVLDASSGEVLWAKQLGGYVLSVAWNHDGTLLMGRARLHENRIKQKREMKPHTHSICNVESLRTA